MVEKDFRPNRYIVTLKNAQEYVREFFEQNPISQLCVLAMYDGKCIRVSDLSGNPNDHVTAIQELRTGAVPKEPKGNASLENALEMARAMVNHTPSHGTREVIIILGALHISDPGDIHVTVRSCMKDRLRVSIIGMGARIKVCTDICSKTNAGDESTYVVALDQTHFRELLMATTTPPVIRRAEDIEATKASLLEMGFPSKVDEEIPSLCACHGQLNSGGYTCSRCKAKVCSLPTSCPSCGLTLILSTHLARSYHHLFPLQNWVTVTWKRARQVGSIQCFSCLSDFPEISEEENGKDDAMDVDDDDDGRTIGGHMDGDMRKEKSLASESGRYECESCEQHFCIDCDVYSHETTHNCPGCLAGGGRRKKMAGKGKEKENNGSANRSGDGETVGEMEVA